MILLKKFRQFSAAVLLFLAFTSCDDDFNTIGGGLVGGEFDALPRYEAGVVAYNRQLTPVQTNNLPVHLLGVYNEPVYGQQRASVMSQLSLSANNPSFGNEPRLDSVVLTLPYFSSQLQPDEEGNAVYRLDSVYGNAPFKLSISRSNFFLNDFDPEANFENRQRYYSDMGPVFENSLIGEAIYENESFRPSPNQVTYRQRDETGEMDTVSVSPRMRIHLPIQFFQENILDQRGSGVLFNNNNFRNFIRGLYFEAEPVNGDGSMMLLNFTHSDAGIVMYYTNTTEDEDGETVSSENSFRFSFGPNVVNAFSQELPDVVQNEISQSTPSAGAENLFLKGGDGSMAIIDLFEDEEELEDLRSRNWLINDANLTFYVNQERLADGGLAEPRRIYLYNLENNQLLLDYREDPTQASDNPNISFSTHAPVLVRDEDGNGLYYRIRITEHVRRILDGTNENVKLGLVVTQNIRLVNNSLLKEPVGAVTRIPSGAVITPKGTVLHGNLSPDADKRLKFNIYYTETSN